MLKLILLVPLLITLTSCARNYTGWNVYRVSPTKNQETKLDKFYKDSRYDFWKKTRGAPIIVSVKPSVEGSLLEFLENNKIKYAIHIRDLGSFLHDLESPFTTRNLESRSTRKNMFEYYLSHSEINKYLDELVGKYPTLVSLPKFGYSYEGRRMPMIKIRDVTVREERPIVFIDAGIHAREWLAPAMALYIINQLTENATNLYLAQSVEWHIAPLVNPDGYEYSHCEDPLWRKTRSQTMKETCFGVDGNRNFDYHWMESGSSDYPCSAIYAGLEPFSEKETKAIRNYIMALKKKIKLYLTFHSFGSVILYPYSYDHVVPANQKELAEVADKADRANRKAGGIPFKVGPGADVMYPASGGSDDWAMGVAGIPLSYTIELPPNTFHPPARDIKKLVTPIFEAVRVFAHHISEVKIYPRRKQRSRSSSESVNKEKFICITICLASRLYFF